MDFLVKRAEEAEETGDLQTALELWKELVAKDPESRFFLRYASVAKKLTRWDEAEHALTEAIRLEPNSSLVMENLGDLWAMRTDKDAAESFRTAKEWFLRGLKRERNACALTLLGNTHVALEEFPEARAAFEEAIEIDPDYEEALYNLAILEEKRDPPKALELLERSVQIDPNYLLAHLALGRLAQRDNDFVRAEYHFRRSVEIDPADYWSNIYLANLLSVQGKNAEAEQIYRFATSLHPEITEGFGLFANFLDSVGKQDEAARLRDRANPTS